MAPSKIGDGEVNLGRKLRISYIGQLVVPQIFKYLIGAKCVEVRLACRFDWHDSIVCTIYTRHPQVTVFSHPAWEYVAELQL